jgi:hypothetical protein
MMIDKSVSTAYDITEERLHQNTFASHFGQLAIIFYGYTKIFFM